MAKLSNATRFINFPNHKTGPTKTVVFDQEHCTANDEVSNRVIPDKGYYEGNYENDRPPLTTFEKELRGLINKHCIENESNTPDFILAEYLAASLAAFNVATRARERWYGRRTF